MVVLQRVVVACFVRLLVAAGQAVQQVGIALGESSGDGAFRRHSLR
jgi:hypothetical protein